MIRQTLFGLVMAFSLAACATEMDYPDNTTTPDAVNEDGLFATFEPVTDGSIQVFYASLSNQTDDTTFDKIQIGWRGELGQEVYETETGTFDAFSLVSEFDLRDQFGSLFNGQTCGDVCIPLGGNGTLAWTGVESPAAGEYYLSTVTGHPTDSAAIDFQTSATPSGTNRVFKAEVGDVWANSDDEVMAATLTFENGETNSLDLHTGPVFLRESGEGLPKQWTDAGDGVGTTVSTLSVTVYSPQSRAGTYTATVAESFTSDVVRVTIGTSASSDAIELLAE